MKHNTISANDNGIDGLSIQGGEDRDEKNIQPFSMSNKECVNIVRQTAFCVEEKPFFSEEEIKGSRA